MITVSVSQAKARLSEYLAKVEAGEEVLVTRRGIPVARLVPPNRARAHIPERMREMERQGLLRIGEIPVSDTFLAAPRPRVPDNAALTALLADREGK